MRRHAYDQGMTRYGIHEHESSARRIWSGRWKESTMIFIEEAVSAVS